MRDISIILLGITGIVVMAALVAIFWVITPQFQIKDILLFVLLFCLVALVLFTLIIKIKDIRAGYPLADERTKKAAYKAGTYSYFLTIWVAILLMFYNGLGVDTLHVPALSTEEFVGVLILSSGSFFMILGLLFLKKGKVY